ncbi:MAG: YqaE/Pmp3 family membrane protein [Psychromonas sp.]
MVVNKIVLIILAILLPPIAVFLKSGAGKDLIINIVLSLIFFVPGVLHALWLITKD